MKLIADKPLQPSNQIRVIALQNVSIILGEFYIAWQG